MTLQRELRKAQSEITRLTHEVNELRNSLNVRFRVDPSGQRFAVYAGDDRLSDWLAVPANYPVTA